MDLGATVCTRSKPKCDDCPLFSTCRARIDGLVSKLPTPKLAKILPKKKIAFLMLQNTDNQVFLEKRPASGIWGGLWSFPEFVTGEEIKEWCLEKKISIQSIEQLNEQRHTFSHYHLDYTVFFVRTNPCVLNIMEANRYQWYEKHQLGTIGLPTPISRNLQNL